MTFTEHLERMIENSEFIIERFTDRFSDLEVKYNCCELYSPPLDCNEEEFIVVNISVGIKDRWLVETPDYTYILFEDHIERQSENEIEYRESIVHLKYNMSEGEFFQYSTIHDLTELNWEDMNLFGKVYDLYKNLLVF